MWDKDRKRTLRYEHKQTETDSHSQGEDFVPLWVEVLVNSVCLQSFVIELQHAERVALTWETVKLCHT